MMVQCSAGKSDKLREARKDLLAIRKTYEEKRMASFKGIFTSFKEVADNEIAFAKEVLAKIAPSSCSTKEHPPVEESPATPPSEVDEP
jgi:hypothetical protein